MIYIVHSGLLSRCRLLKNFVVNQPRLQLCNMLNQFPHSGPHVTRYNYRSRNTTAADVCCRNQLHRDDHLVLLLLHLPDISY